MGLHCFSQDDTKMILMLEMALVLVQCWFDAGSMQYYSHLSPPSTVLLDSRINFNGRSTSLNALAEYLRKGVIL
jgi:hypothetical protein